MRSKLERQARELGLDKTHVQFAGWLENVDAVLRITDILVHPSLSHELLPYSIKEGMAHALPVVATNVGGIPELVRDGRTGLLVSPGDDRALASAIRQLFESPRTRARFGAAGQARIRRDFTMEHMAKGMRAAWTGRHD